MSKKDEVLSALANFVNAFADFADETEKEIETLKMENKELRSKNLDVAEAFESAARVLRRGNI